MHPISRPCRSLGPLGLLLVSFAAQADKPVTLPDSAALNSVDPTDLRNHIKVLASDEFEGRAPGTSGETLTVDYLTGEFQRLGLSPGNPDGTWLQPVPMQGITSQSQLHVTAAGQRLALTHGTDFVADSAVPEPSVAVHDSGLVFVGYGVVAPDQGWDDYKDVDVRGKTVIVLMNDPQVPAAGDRGRLDARAFRGVIKTTYATVRHKREVAAAKGAAALIVVHEAEHAGWEFEVILADAGREQLHLPETGAPRLQADAMMPVAKVRELFRSAGQDFDALRARAVRRDFRPVPLAATVDFDIRNTVREVVSHNVVAKIDGRDPARRNEFIVYTAHWDHLGRDPNLPGDQIYNGAVDNASGVAALLEIAEAWHHLPQPPARSVLFIATTAEEHGLLGARHYVTHPLYPLAHTVADLNLDTIGFWPPTRDFRVVGFGDTNMDSVLEAVAGGMHRAVSFDMAPQQGANLRQDAHAFAVAGVPSLYLTRGIEFLDAGGDSLAKRIRGGGGEVFDDYHQVDDTIKRDWNYTGAVELARFAFAVGYRLAESRAFPQWHPDSEFRGRRDAMMESTGTQNAPPERARP